MWTQGSQGDSLVAIYYSLQNLLHYEQCIYLYGVHYQIIHTSSLQVRGCRRTASSQEVQYSLSTSSQEINSQLYLCQFLRVPLECFTKELSQLYIVALRHLLCCVAVSCPGEGRAWLQGGLVCVCMRLFTTHTHILYILAQFAEESLTTGSQPSVSLSVQLTYLSIQ